MRAYAKSLKKAKQNELTFYRQGGNILKVMKKLQVFIQGWLDTAS